MKMPSIRAGSALRSFLVPLFFWASLFFSHCDPDGGYQYVYPISEETKDYCYFKEGSWWVYVDSNRMVYDTVTCVYSVFDKQFDADRMRTPIESITCRFQSSFYKHSYHCQGFNTMDFDTN